MDALTQLAHQRKLEALRLQAWARSCLSKRRYSTEERVNIAARRLGGLRRVTLRGYYCMHCGGWHLTKRPQP